MPQGVDEKPFLNEQIGSEVISQLICMAIKSLVMNARLPLVLQFFLVLSVSRTGDIHPAFVNIEIDVIIHWHRIITKNRCYHSLS